jgi:hypothetical protein
MIRSKSLVVPDIIASEPSDAMTSLHLTPDLNKSNESIKVEVEAAAVGASNSGASTERSADAVSSKAKNGIPFTDGFIKDHMAK